MDIKGIKSRLEYVLDLSIKTIDRYGDDEVNNIGISHSRDIDAFYTSLIMTMGNHHRFMDGLAVFFVYAYMCGQDSMAAQQSDEFKAAKERLDKFAKFEAIGAYGADQLIADVKVVMEVLK